MAIVVGNGSGPRRFPSECKHHSCRPPGDVVIENAYTDVPKPTIMNTELNIEVSYHK